MLGHLLAPYPFCHHELHTPGWLLAWAGAAAATYIAACSFKADKLNSPWLCCDNNLLMGAAVSAKSGKYVGQLLNGTVRHGRGSCALSDGSFYEGDWCGYSLALVCVFFT